MKTKVCNKCKIKKSLDKFDKDNRSKNGIQSICKSCRKIYRLENKNKIKNEFENWKNKNNEHYKDYKKNYNLKYKNENKQWKKEWYEKNKEIIREKRKIKYQTNKEEINKKNKEWREKNPEYRSLYEVNRRKKDILYKIITNIRSLIRISFTRQGFSKKSKTYQILGCSFEELQKYLFKNIKLKYTNFEPKEFLEKNKYHIDHIVPLSTAKTEEDVIRLCHYTNLQLLTKEDNLIKHDKLILK